MVRISRSKKRKKVVELVSCITTYTKKSIDPLHPKQELIDPIDIAHALSLLCRANGHFPHFYSVAQHALNCAKEANARGFSQRVQLACLLHDASEAFLSDITRPVKPCLSNYLAIEFELQQIIYEKWIPSPLTEEEKKQVSEVDDALLYHEFLSLMDERIADDTPTLKSSPSFDFRDFALVEREFLRELARLSVFDENPYVVGVDRGDKQWVAVKLQGNMAACSTFETIDALCAKFQAAEAILIDMPIGLAESSTELSLRPDADARSYLRAAKKTSCVFPTPLRQVVYAESISKAWDLNHELCGSMTPQSAAILPTICEVDTFLQSHPEWKNRLLESHPECAFQALNKNIPLTTKKSSSVGICQRCDILRQYGVEPEFAIAQLSPSISADTLDALALAVTAKKFCAGEYKTLPQAPVCDRTGLLMQIILFENKVEEIR